MKDIDKNSRQPYVKPQISEIRGSELMEIIGPAAAGYGLGGPHSDPGWT